MKIIISNFEEYKHSLASDDEIKLVEKLRHIALKHLPSFMETFKYGFPVYDGKGKYGFAIKSNYVSIYFHHNKLLESIKKYKIELGKFTFGKDTLRFRNISDVPLDIIEKIIIDLFV